MISNPVELLTIFVLAAFVGFEVISKVPSILHTPLMSGSNAIHGVILVGAMIIANEAHGPLEVTLALVAVILATLNIVGGVAVTDRMLEMFKGKSDVPRARRPEPAQAGAGSATPVAAPAPAAPPAGSDPGAPPEAPPDQSTFAATSPSASAPPMPPPIPPLPPTPPPVPPVPPVPPTPSPVPPPIPPVPPGMPPAMPPAMGS